MQTVTNAYIANLAIADECFLVGLPFLLVTSRLKHWPFGLVACKLFVTTSGINQFTSSAFLAVMSADRYVAVCHAVKGASLRTPVVSRLVAVTTWLVSAVLMTPLFMYSSTRVTNNETGTTTCNVFLPDDDDTHTYVIFTLYNFLASFAVPLMLIIIFYSQVIMTLRNTRARKKNTRKKVTRLVLTVIIAYVVCWLPYWLGQIGLMIQLLEIVTMPVSHMTLVNYNIIASIPMYCNSAINPILYAFLSDNFRKSFFKACKCCKALGRFRRRRRNQSQPRTLNHGRRGSSNWPRNTLNCKTACLTRVEGMTTMEEDEDHQRLATEGLAQQVMLHRDPAVSEDEAEDEDIEIEEDEGLVTTGNWSSPGCSLRNHHQQMELLVTKRHSHSAVQGSLITTSAIVCNTSSPGSHITTVDL
ncbi:unnamed protein product [Notodromas monacha]|uniref:G-protein coupled receptors family 1 profile domain-containing protein n=1 Tax=Notodromas monacha TaxID=399045 RepID=A0A7R9G9M5_9CRUS|nr:unnamed protein product [Notodromas monacha]CAG0914422.1 unnamed protein product [Notodromas monacha]